jgi:hypothetical protein
MWHAWERLELHSVKNLKGRNHLEDPGVEKRTLK